jgi:hypothetical protein
MAIDRNFLYADPLAAQAFLRRQTGAILHETGHFEAANFEWLVSGHVIIEDRNDDDCAGSFVPDHISLARLRANPSIYRFVCAAGAVTELYFCDRTSVRRHGHDIELYSALSWNDAGLAQDAVVKHWQNAYFARIDEIAARIEVNFDRCMAHCRSNRFLLGAHHVIPTCVLKSSHRGLFARLDELVRTWPKKERISALERYLAE